VNPITFNDGIERALATYPYPPIIAQSVFGNWQKAPLFDYVTTYEHERELTKTPQIEALEAVPMPFNTFRIAVAETAVPWKDGENEIGHGTYRTNMVVTKAHDELFIIVEIKELWDHKTAPAPHMPLPLYMLLGNLRHDPQGTADGAYFYNMSLCVKGEWLPVNETLGQGISQLVTGAIGSVAAFLIDASMPSTHVVEVRPNKQGKSIEWTRSRTHFTLITHGHPANKKEVAEGTRVVVDRDEELKRMSHDRRGHWRTYRHERYTYARGSTRWVKQTWCGPKEWQDEGGRQIYRILDPVT
jgi:hypothetical protein